MFDEKLAQRFPPEREEDMKITLLPDALQTINCKVYLLNKKEMDVLRKFLTEEEEKGYIKQGSSLYTMPVKVQGP